MKEKEVRGGQRSDGFYSNFKSGAPSLAIMPKEAALLNRRRVFPSNNFTGEGSKYDSPHLLWERQLMSTNLVVVLEYTAI